MNKNAVLHILYTNNIMQNMHEDIIGGLVGILVNEYNQYIGPDCNPKLVSPPPILRTVVNMVASLVMRQFTEQLICEVIDAVEEVESKESKL